MQTPTTKTSSETLFRLAVYLMARLRAEQRTRDLAPRILARRDDLRRAWNHHIEADEATILAEAMADGAGNSLDLVVKGFADGLFNDVGRTRQSTRLRSILPDGQVPFTAPRLFEKSEAVGRLLRHLALFPEDPVVRVWQPQIRAHHLDFEETLAAVLEARTTLDHARSAEILARSAFIATYVAVYGAIIEAMDSKAAAEDYFMRYRASPHEDRPPEESGAGMAQVG